MKIFDLEFHVKSVFYDDTEFFEAVLLATDKSRFAGIGYTPLEAIADLCGVIEACGGLEEALEQ
jgi:hypothetical protein